jgi:3-vinyl bacteriochlorophyllide hydratase
MAEHKPLKTQLSHETARRSAARADALGRAPASTWIDAIAPAPWTATAGSCAKARMRAAKARTPLYTAEQRARRDATPWTLVQGVLAPLQFLVFLVSLGFVLRALTTGEGYHAATLSVLVKTGVLYLIMVTGAIWEKVVFGRYLFAPAFFWEDVFSMAVLGLHTAYVAAVLWHIGTPGQQMLLALAAYATYVVNATQFLLKLRAARLEAPAKPARPEAAMGAMA